MIITYPSFIENNPHDLLSPHHDSFVSCFESRFNDSLDEIGLRDFTFFDKDTLYFQFSSSCHSSCEIPTFNDTKDPVIKNINRNE